MQKYHNPGGSRLVSLILVCLGICLLMSPLIDANLRPPEWCERAMKYYFDKDVRPLMGYFCSLQAGHSKTFKEVGQCMEAVKTLCWNECEDSKEDEVYRSCVFDELVVSAYRDSEEKFHECIGENMACIRLRREWKVGQGCWQECFKERSSQCMQGCQPVADLSPEAMNYLRCALKMNPAHLAFRNCLLRKIP